MTGQLSIRSTPLEIQLLGAWSVRAGARQLQLPTKKSQALFAYVALRDGRPQERDALRGLLWPDSPKAQSQASLRQALAMIRKALPAGLRSVMQVTERAVALTPALITVDVVLVERCLTERTLASLERAAGLFAGPLLEGFATGEDPFDDWLQAEREQLNRRMLDGLEHLAALQVGARGPEEAMQTALSALRLEPLEERIHRLVMRLYLLQGRRAEAIQHYERCAALLARELEVEPDEQTKSLHRELLRGSVTSGDRGGATASAPAMPLIGRAAELAWLEQAAVSAWRGERRLCVVLGDAGVGKTRLLDALREAISARGGRCLRGRCFESEQVLPFALWVDLLRNAGASLDEATLTALSPVYRAELTRLLPAWRAPAEEPPPALPDARALFEAFAALMARCAESAPLLVLLEDLHWADGMSLRLLSFLVRRISAEARVAVIASVRAEEIDAALELRRVLRELQREQLVSELSLGPLGRDDTTALVRSVAPRALGDVTCEKIWAISEGNPLVALECARGLDAPLALPDRVRALVLEHAERLSPSAREALAVAAVIGREFDFELLREACGADARALAATCEELVPRRVLQASSGQLDFAHDRVREVFYEDLLPARRALLHGAVARALERLWPERLDELCGTIGYHYARAAQPEESVSFLLRFAERSIRNAGLEQALAALVEAERQCAALPPLLRDVRTLELAIRRCTCFMHLGRAALVEPALTPLRATLERLDRPELSAAFHASLALAASFLGDGGGAVEHGTVALTAAQRAGDLHTAGLAHSVLSLEACQSGRFERGVRHGREAIELLDPARSDPEFVAFAHLHLGTNYLSLGDWQRARSAFMDASAIGERAESLRLRSIALAMIGAARLCCGELEASLEVAREAFAYAPDPHSAWLSQLLLVRTSAIVASLRRDARILRDEPCASALRALELSTSASGLPSMRGFVGRAMAVLAEAYLAQDDIVGARDMLTRAFDARHIAPDPLGVAVALRTRARLSLAVGDLGQAAKDLDEAQRRFEALEARFECAATRLTAAQLAVARGDQESVAREFAAAEQAFAALELAGWPARLVEAANRL